MRYVIFMTSACRFIGMFLSSQWFGGTGQYKMTLDEFNLLLKEVGPLDESIEVVMLVSDGYFSVQLEQRGSVDLEFDEASQRVTLSADIGTPPAETAQRAYEILLSYSLAWKQTGGVFVGLSGVGGSLVMMITLSATELTSKLLTTVVVNLAQRAVVWRKLIAAGQDADLRTEDSATFSEAMIRI